MSLSKPFLSIIDGVPSTKKRLKRKAERALVSVHVWKRRGGFFIFSLPALIKAPANIFF
jgi:hypothetical protein